MAQTQQGGMLNRVLKLAAVVAVLLAGTDLVLDVVTTLLSGGNIEFGDIVVSQIRGIPYDLGLVGGAALVVLQGGSKDGLLKGGAIAYAGSLVSSILYVVLEDFVDLTASTFVWDLQVVFLVVALGAVVRLYNGQTLLPGVDVRL